MVWKCTALCGRDPYRPEMSVVVGFRIADGSRGRSAFIPARITASAVAFCMPAGGGRKVIVICQWIFLRRTYRTVGIGKYASSGGQPYHGPKALLREKQYLLPLIMQVRRLCANMLRNLNVLWWAENLPSPEMQRSPNVWNA